MLYFEDAKRFPALHDLGRFMLNQGCRPEEILALQISDIDLEPSRSVIMYVHVRQESQDREMELFEPKNISEAKRWSGFGPVGNAETGKSKDRRKRRKGLSDKKIN
jgi:hypothetical protein